MGFITGNTLYLKAKLTPTGRQKIVERTNKVITHFSLGDSDAYYKVSSGLGFNEVPTISGDYNGLDIDNGGVDYKFRSEVFKSSNDKLKNIEDSSYTLTTSFDDYGFKTISYSGGSIVQNKVSLYNLSDSLTNLFYSFSLPITSNDFNLFTGKTFSSGGYSDTCYSGLAQNEILVIGIDNNEYGEIIDGKSIKIDLQTTASTYTLYSTFENGIKSDDYLDFDIKETSNRISIFGSNLSLLFSDSIKRPNNDSTKSWGDGYGFNKPFSVGKKHKYNFIDNPGLGLYVDKSVGIAYLDKGFFVITEPTIVNDFNTSDPTSTATTITFSHGTNKVSQLITCVADRGEFNTSTNPTWTPGDPIRITELGLYDSDGDLVAVCKLNTTYFKSSEDLVVFNIRIEY